MPSLLVFVSAVYDFINKLKTMFLKLGVATFILLKINRHSSLSGSVFYTDNSKVEITKEYQRQKLFISIHLVLYCMFICVVREKFKSRRLRWAGHVARLEEGRSAFKILTGKPVGKRPLGRPRRRWEDNIRKDLKEIGISARNWVDSAQDRDYWRALVNAALKLRVP